MEINKVYEGNCLDLFKELDDESIDCVITSPPYWQLRDYKWDGQWGLEPTFQEYLEHLWQMIDEVYRVLKPTGTAWINLGDTYSTNSGSMGSELNQPLFSDKANESLRFRQGKSSNSRNGEWANRNGATHTGLPSKCLMLIPHRFAIGCIDRNWIVRNDIIWAKRNGMPESVTDRFSKKHEYFFLMVKQEKYYFDLDGIRDKQSPATIKRYDYGWNGNEDRDYVNGPQNNMNRYLGDPEKKKEAIERGKNPGSVSDFWDVCTQPSSDEHYAAYNDKLIGKPIVAGCPKDGITLDPFCGTATTGCRALELGRKFIGFEGSPKYVKMANKNLQPYLKQTQLFT